MIHPCDTLQNFVPPARSEVLMALELPAHLMKSVSSRWRRESRGPVSRVRHGLKLADELLLRVHVTKSDVGALKQLNSYQGSPKIVPDAFWENL